jgi:hypothetical protein
LPVVLIGSSAMNSILRGSSDVESLRHLPVVWPDESFVISRALHVSSSN